MATNIRKMVALRATKIKNYSKKSVNSYFLKNLRSFKLIWDVNVPATFLFCYNGFLTCPMYRTAAEYGKIKALKVFIKSDYSIV
ncbi:hypothetical protein CD107_05255 [Mammaliicoccus vitulinus]|nr:hypothetical protein CD107_05255 [Mammaliicoccus vitulinus]